MALQSIQLEDFRCFAQASLELPAGTTLIAGPNGSGKSSLLEAIFVLGRGRSFRTPKLDKVVRRGSPQLRVVGRVDAGPRAIVMGLEYGRGETRARIDGSPADSLADLSVRFPVQAIDPGVHKLIEGSPILRRRFLDWGVFHVEHGYLDTWQRFHRALRQRNAALRAGSDDSELDAWDQELGSLAGGVTLARERYLAAVQAELVEACSQLLDAGPELSYWPGWGADKEYAAVLAERRALDRERAATTAGPHRGDLTIRTPHGLARDTVSRGQQKLLAAGLILGQLRYHQVQGGAPATLLLDDPAAELDTERLHRLLRLVGTLDGQRIVTSLRPDFDALGEPNRMFHVEQGTVRQML